MEERGSWAQAGGPPSALGASHSGGNDRRTRGIPTVLGRLGIDAG